MEWFRVGPCSSGLGLLLVVGGACAGPGGGGGGAGPVTSRPDATTVVAPDVAVVATDAATTPPTDGSVAVDGSSLPPDGAVASDGAVAPDVADAACDAVGVAVSGLLAVPSAFAFDRARVAMTHKRDVDAFEDGCIAEVEVVLHRGDGCALTVVAGGVLDGDQRLRVARVAFTADSACPGFADADEGLYDDTALMEVMELRLGALRVPDADARESCFTTTLDLTLDGALRDALGRRLEITETHLHVAGVVQSIGATSIACPCRSTCERGACGADGCGGACGGCDVGERCDPGLRRCVCAPDCAGRACGDDGCGGVCGACGPGDACELGRCVCQPTCGARTCGDDGCGDACGTCGPTQRCDDGACVEDPTLATCDGICNDGDQLLLCFNDCCGNGTCDGLETRITCPSDCAVGCGDLACDDGESVQDCPFDCSTCGDFICAATDPIDCPFDCLF